MCDCQSESDSEQSDSKSGQGSQILGLIYLPYVFILFMYKNHMWYV